MLDHIKNLVTRENLTLAIAILGAAGTVIGWIYAAISNAKKLDIRLIKVFRPEIDLVIYVAISNRSRLPISINSVSVLIDDVSFPCAPIPTMIYYTDTGYPGEQPRRQEYFTLNLPMNLGTLAGASGFLAFDIPKEYLKKISTPLTVQVSTNRGRPVESTIPFEGFSDLDV